MASSVFQNRAVANVVRILPDTHTATLRSAITGTGSTYFATLAPEDRTRVVAGIVKALSNVSFAVMVAGVAVVILAIFLPVSGCKLYG